MPVLKEPTAEEIEAYKAKWAGHGECGAGRKPSELAQFFKDRRYREPDPNLPKKPGKSGLYGPPPPDSPYRCTGWCRARNARCKDWAVRGQHRCKHHGGGRAVAERRRKQVASRYIRPAYILNRYPAVYSKYLGPKLQERLAELAGVPDELDLTNELRLVRSTAVDVAMLYSSLMEMSALTPEAKAKKLEALVSTGSVLKDAAEAVGDMAGRIVDIQAKRNDKLTVQSLSVVTTQIVEMAYETFGEAPEMIELVHKLADKIKGLRLPSDAAMGTSITPDMDVAAMDATIPNVQENEQ